MASDSIGMERRWLVECVCGVEAGYLIRSEAGRRATRKASWMFFIHRSSQKLIKSESRSRGLCMCDAEMMHLSDPPCWFNGEEKDVRKQGREAKATKWLDDEWTLWRLQVQNLRFLFKMDK